MKDLVLLVRPVIFYFVNGQTFSELCFFKFWSQLGPILTLPDLMPHVINICRIQYDGINQRINIGILQQELLFTQEFPALYYAYTRFRMHIGPFLFGSYIPGRAPLYLKVGQTTQKHTRYLRKTVISPLKQVIFHDMTIILT